MQCNGNFKQWFNIFLIISEAWQGYESKAYEVPNHNLKLQSKKLSRTRDIPNFPTQGWADTTFYTRNWSETYMIGQISKVASVIITIRNSSCRKVMFSQAFVKNSVHGGCTPPQADTPLHRHPLLGRHPPKAATPPGQTHRPHPRPHPHPRRPLQWTVRILLECILIFKISALFCIVKLH